MRPYHIFPHCGRWYSPGYVFKLGPSVRLLATRTTPQAVSYSFAQNCSVAEAESALALEVCPCGVLHVRFPRRRRDIACVQDAMRDACHRRISALQ